MDYNDVTGGTEQLKLHLMLLYFMSKYAVMLKLQK